MAEAYIVDAVRTPAGKRGGALAEMHSADLAAHTISALVRRTGFNRVFVERGGKVYLGSQAPAG